MKRMGLLSRRRRLAAVLARLAVELVTQLGLGMAEAPRHLGGVSTSGISRAIRRGTGK